MIITDLDIKNIEGVPDCIYYISGRDYLKIINENKSLKEKNKEVNDAYDLLLYRALRAVEVLKCSDNIFAERAVNILKGN